MRKRHSPAFKAKIVAEALKEEKTITQIASEHEVHPNQISAWKAAALNGLPTLFERESKVQIEHAAHQQQLDELYSQIGRLTTQVTWLKKKSGLDPYAA
jgi:putative transposase